jgi:membrane-associated PAP2 superfamily phosphatase
MAAQGRGFWMHQLVEYGVAGGLIMMSAQSRTPVAPILVSIAVLMNAAVSDGPMSAYSWLPRKAHRILDWVIIAVALVCMVVLDLDSRARLALLAIAVVMSVVALGTNYAKRLR